MAEAADLKREKPKVSEYNCEACRAQAQIGEVLALVSGEAMEERTEGVLMEEEEGCDAVLDHVMSERRNVMGDIKELCDQRDELNEEIQGKIAGWQEWVDELGEPSMCQCFRL